MNLKGPLFFATIYKFPVFFLFKIVGFSNCATDRSTVPHSSL